MAQVESANHVQIGTIIADTYQITSLLGRGGMGTVWEATHARLPGKRVAIKVLHPEVAKDQESLARFRREAEITSRIGHPNIVDVHDFNQLSDGTPYLILEFLEGISLEERIDAGNMKVDEVIALARQIGSGLRAAHAEGIVHRDLKPQNIFLARTTDAAGNAAARARILDFGISKIRGSSTVQTQDSTILGTPQYMAPEQATGHHSAVDQRTDVFAFGAMIYEMLAGRPAFDGQTIPEVVFKVVYEEPTPLDQLSAAPPQVVRAVHQALAKKQEERFPTVEAFVEALSGTALSVAGAPVPATVQPRAMEQDAAQDAALASTIASGNYPPVSGVHGAASLNNPAAAAMGTAQTIDSGRMDPAAIGLPPQQPPQQPQPQPQPAIAQTQAVSHGSSMGLKIALVLALIIGIGGAGVGLWAVTRPAATTAQNGEVGETGDGDSSEANPAAAIDAATAAISIDAAADVKPKDVKPKDVKPKDVKPKDVKPKDVKPKDVKPKDVKPKDVKDDDGKDETTTVKKDEFSGPDDPRKDLKEARGLIRKDPNRALFLIRRALGNKGRGAAFHVVQAKAHCIRRDITNVRATMNKLSKRAQARVARFCKANGFDIE